MATREKEPRVSATEPSRVTERAEDWRGLRKGELLLTAAYLYYAKDRSQGQVAQVLGLSRATVSRLLAEARRTGVVRIEVTVPPPDPDLELTLARQLGLREAYAAPGIADVTDPGDVLAPALANALQAAGLGEGDAMTVSWGRATWSVSRAALPTLRGVIVVPAVGGLNDEEPCFQVNEISRSLGRAVGGHSRLLHAPAFVSDELRESLLGSAEIRSVIELWNVARVGLFGVGTLPRPSSSPGPAALIRTGTTERAIGDVAGRFYAADGSPVHYPGEEQLFAPTREQLLAIPTRIGLAAGLEKVAAIRGAAKAGLINVLVTDIVTASALAAG